MGTVNLGHFIIGFQGLAILRTWLGPGSDTTSKRVGEVAELLANPDQPPMSVEFDAPEMDAQTGYAEWSASYDSGPNALIALEEPVVHQLLAKWPAGRPGARCGLRHRSPCPVLGFLGP